ncbi:DUF362 domain-containing protein [Pectinatus sottacetonis]|uniref:DUF362 domain-containing protein n=1 Tax=Pectinatus sottacetonis TaxID=1002795 RepID=UPI0018C702FA|nr:4Fe-4S binding protein [Pectinatus sottacetonis]
MAYEITAACRACGKCARNCPAGAIKKSDSIYKIDTALCIECGKCYSLCPFQAIAVVGNSDTVVQPVHNTEKNILSEQKNNSQNVSGQGCNCFNQRTSKAAADSGTFSRLKRYFSGKKCGRGNRRRRKFR